MQKRFFLLLALVLLSSSAFALSAQEAIDFATKQNNFLYSSEIPEIYPNTRISSQGKNYWVITALSSGALSGFVPILDKESPSLAEGAVTRRELIKTNHVLRYYLSLKDTAVRQGLWLFDATNVKFFSDLSQDLKNEKVDLSTVKTELAGFPSLQAKADSLNEMLGEMSPLAGEVSGSLLEAMSFESDYLAKPDTNRLGKFKANFLDSFGLIQELGNAQSDYLAELDELRQAIALASIAIETKQGLNSLANVPTSMQQFTSKATLAVGLEQKINAIFDNALANADNLVLDLGTREKRNAAYLAIYARDEGIYGKTGQASLNALFNVLLSDDYYYEWKEQQELVNAKSGWEKAVSYYEAANFQQAEQFAAKAKTSGIKVYEGGFTAGNDAINTDLIINGIIVLVIAIIAIYAIKNRGRILNAFSQKEEGVEMNNWDR